VVKNKDDPRTNWQWLWGKRLLNTVLGLSLTSLEKRAMNPCVIDQCELSIKRCSDCG